LFAPDFCNEEKTVRTEQRSEGLRGLSVVSILFAVLGGVFYWWVPLGIVWALTGLVFGVIDWTRARRRSRTVPTPALGLQTVTFQR
jgi:hypothetical protein